MALLIGQEEIGGIGMNIAELFSWLIIGKKLKIEITSVCRILVWEDGFCNFAASSSSEENGGGGGGGEFPGSSVVYGLQPCRGLQPELFFKMSHEIYNYGEG